MPIANIQDAREVEHSLQAILTASDIDARIRAIRSLFVETLDYYHADSQVSLQDAGNDQLPAEAYLVAQRDGVSVVYVPLDSAATNRVTGAVASAAAKAVGNILADNVLLLFTSRDKDQLHIINPDLTGTRPRLQRIVAYRDQPQRTTVQQIAGMWHNYGVLGKTIGEAIAIAFSVEPVTKDFFEAYRGLFQNAKDQISGFGNSETEQEQKHLFTQTLFNRLMFVYFLSRKGWLTFNGDADHLNALWRDYRANSEQTNFYKERLYHLFFFGLNNPQSRDLNFKDSFMESIFGTVPFLNGGLFEPNELDNRKDIIVPDTAIGQVLTGLFDRFNFTVMESTPFDIEVAVDPEMLGKVFEELVTGRHDSGAYYTPRPVVSFMCREALKGYLEGKNTGADADAIARFVDQKDPAGISLADARRISEALSQVTVVDPACGSGAYLLGMMQELVELQNTLYSVGVDAKGLYDLKLEIIQRNLYGVDIDDFAVNIAMLRLWLSLAIDYEGEKPEPLPNLDFKVVCGDSLLGPDPSVGLSERNDETSQIAMGREPERMKRLDQLKTQFLRASSSVDKARLRAEVQEIKSELREALGDASSVPEGAIDWRVEFAEVFAQRRGFDIAIANPPYIQLQSNGGRLANLYKDAGYQTFARTGDIYQLFYERGCQLLTSDSGLLTYITSNSWLKAEYGKATRRYFAGSHTPLLLLELGKDVFESAIVDSGVLMLRTGGGGQPFPAVDMDRVETADVPPAPELWGQVRPDGDAPWSVMSLTEQSVLAKMRAKGRLLKDWGISIQRGVITGYNKAFIVDTATREALIAADQRSAEIIKPILRGRDIQRFQAQWANQWLIVVKFGSYKTLPEAFPSIYRYLLQHEDRLKARGQCRYSRSGSNGSNAEYPGQHHWLELDNNPRDAYLQEFAKEKLLWIELVDEGRFSYDNSGIYGEATTFIMTGESLKYLCAVLNSSLIRWFLNQIAPTSGMGTLRWKKVYVETIPVPKLSAAKQRPFVRLLDRILEAKAADPDADTSYLEWDIDRLVYDLYGLTEEEDTAIERSLGLIHQTDEEEDAALARAMTEGMNSEYATREEVMAILQAPDGS